MVVGNADEVRFCVWDPAGVLLAGFLHVRGVVVGVRGVWAVRTRYRAFIGVNCVLKFKADCTYIGQTYP